MVGDGLTLADCVTLTRGTTYQSAQLGKPGPVLLGLASIAPEGGFRSFGLKTYGGASPANLLLRPGDLYVSLKDVTQAGRLLGAVARVPQTVTLGRLTQDTVKLTPKSGAPPAAYLYWLLRTPEYREYCKERATGTTNLALSRADFLAFSVPTATASRVLLCDLLSTLDDKIELNQRMADTLEAMARALFRSWFVDFDPVHARAEGLPAAGLPDHLAALFPDSFGDDGLPDAWRSGSLAKISALNPESWTRASMPLTLEYIDLAGVKWGKIESVQAVAREEAPSRAQRVLIPGDTVVGTVRPGNGSYAFISRPGLTGSTGFAVLRPCNATVQEFVYLAATRRENIEALAQLADGAAYPAVRPEVVADTPLALPSDAVLHAFAHATAPLLDAVGRRLRQSKTLADLRDALLPKLISGELRIADAEQRVAAA